MDLRQWILFLTGILPKNCVKELQKKSHMRCIFICEEAVEEKLFALHYVPYGYITQEIRKRAT